MTEKWLPVLTRCRVDKNYITPGESVFVTAYFRSGETRAPEDYTFALDIIYGHQRTVENKQYDYRVTARSMPPVTSWKAGNEYAVTFRWEYPRGWGGTYHFFMSITDRRGAPQEFTGKDGVTLREKAGETDVGWGFGSPWVLDNREAVEYAVAGEPPGAGNAPGVCGGAETRLRNREILTCENSQVNVERFLSSERPIASLWKPDAGELFLEGEAKCYGEYAEKSAGSAFVRLFCRGEAAAEYDLIRETDGNVQRIRIENVREYNGYDLLDVRFPALAELSDGYLLDFFGSGRLVPIADAVPVFFRKTYDIRNAAVLYNAERMLIVESAHIDSRIITGITCVNSQNKGFIGGEIVLKIRGNKNIRSIPVKNPPVFTVEEIAADGADRPLDWQYAALLLRRGVSRNFAHAEYDGISFYKQLTTYGLYPDEKYRRDESPTVQWLFKTVSFEQVADNVRKFANITDNVKQVMYVTGWQKGGFDNAYPFALEAEERCGGTEGLRRCLTEMRCYNALTGMHDNFDDVSFPNRDYPYVAKDEDGKPWRGWLWGSGLTYELGVRRYVDSGETAKRVARLFETYPLEKTYHLDVLTAETCRYDFDPERPASAQDNYDAKMEIVREFNRRGADVTSELLTHPAVGKIGFALHNRLDMKEEFIPGGRFVPLVQMIYHGTIGYCAPTGSKTDILWALLLGGHTFYEEDVAGPLSVGRFYINNIPAMLLYNEYMTGFRRDGDTAAAYYTNDCRVEADFGSMSYRVIIRGRPVGRDFSTFAPGSSPGSWLAYSLEGGTFTYPLPEDLRGRDLEAVELTAEGEGGIFILDVYEVTGDEIVLRLPAGTPVKIRVRNCPEIN